MRIAIATCSVMPDQFTDDVIVNRLLSERGAEITYEPWDELGDADGNDLVVLRSPWDYSTRREEFISWARGIGERLHNSPGLVDWNSDKAYMGDLLEAGLPVVETEFVAPGEAWAGSDVEIVVKPTVSAGARDTGRFKPQAHETARALIDAIHAAGKVAMVQPFQASVDEAGETALVFIDGEFRYSLRKRAVLSADEVAPVRESDLRVAEAMYDPELVVAGSHEADELEVAERIVAHVTERFSYLPLYARVDLLRDADGAPVLLELEAIEPNLYFDQVPEGAEHLADAIVARARNQA